MTLSTLSNQSLKKIFALILLLSVLIACEEIVEIEKIKEVEIEKIKEVIKEVPKDEPISPEIDTIYKLLEGSYTTFDYNITRNTDFAYANRLHYNVHHPLLCNYLDTVAFDMNLVKKYTMTYDKKRKRMKGVKESFCTASVDSVFWTIELLDIDIRYFYGAFFTNRPFVIIEKDNAQILNCIYDVNYFNKDLTLNKKKLSVDLSYHVMMNFQYVYYLYSFKEE